jgi:hypothetical protein
MTGRAARAATVAVLLAAGGGCAGEMASAFGGEPLACMPAVSVGPAGTLPMVDELPAGQPVSAMLVWPRGVPPKASARATAAGATVVGAFTSHRALGVRATGAQLARLREELARPEVFLASAGTSQLCVGR